MLDLICRLCRFSGYAFVFVFTVLAVLFGWSSLDPNKTVMMIIVALIPFQIALVVFDAFIWTIRYIITKRKTT